MGDSTPFPDRRLRGRDDGLGDGLFAASFKEQTRGAQIVQRPEMGYNGPSTHKSGNGTMRWGIRPAADSAIAAPWINWRSIP